MNRLPPLLFSLLVMACAIVPAHSTFDLDPPGDREIVVLIHGLARSSAAMWLLNLRLRKAGFHVESIGYRSLDQTPEAVVADISEQIDRCCSALANRVHFVGHSLGGLLARAYLQDRQLQNLGRVVLIGSPNQGTGAADYARDKWWARIAGPTALSLGTDADSFPNALADPYYPVGIIAGIRDGDNEFMLPGLDDGLVPLESTKVRNMTDFVVVRVGHTMMRYDEAVANHTIHFLKTGRFIR